MINTIFTIGFGLFIFTAFAWCFRFLPQEKWQILGCIPRAKSENGDWSGINFTYYGFFNACAYVIAVAMVFSLTGASGIPTTAVAIGTAVLLAVCAPAARIVARVVEKKRFTFSVGGASFVGVMILPLVAWGTQIFVGAWWGMRMPILIFLAAVAVGYAFGEGIGRLACISFGCCYGKPLQELSPRLQRLFRKANFIFYGNTKKIAYAHHLDGVQVIPIQGITAVLYCLAGLVGLCLFLNGWFRTAFAVCMLVTQAWRFFSEFFRADDRGGGQISAYQYMSLVSALYAVLLMAWFPLPAISVAPDILAGFITLWNPVMLLSLQILWLLVFLYTGRSRVTASRMSFYVLRESI